MSVPSPVPRGRGAQSNATGRFESRIREAFDDGWTPDDEAPAPLRTHVTPERAKTIISRNDSPDIGFDRSINRYRGCEHGCIYWVFTHPMARSRGVRSSRWAIGRLPTLEPDVALPLFVAQQQTEFSLVPLGPRGSLTIEQAQHRIDPPFFAREKIESPLAFPKLGWRLRLDRDDTFAEPPAWDVAIEESQVPRKNYRHSLREVHEVSQRLFAPQHQSQLPVRVDEIGQVPKRFREHGSTIVFDPGPVDFRCLVFEAKRAVSA